MRARILPPEEWDKLPERPQWAVDPSDISVVVVEDGEKVVACMTVLRATHLEGTWVSPEHRNAGVVRRLLRLATQTAKSRGSSWAFTGAADEAMHSILSRLGAAFVPMSTYVISTDLGGRACPPQQ